jgi:hypothetical protein
MSYVAVETLFEVRLAEFVQMRFEAEGIPVLMHSIGQAQLFGGPTFGGIRVEVPEEYAVKAADILKQVKRDLDAG